MQKVGTCHPGGKEVGVAIFNVHSWSDIEGWGNLKRIVKLLKNANVDILGLCEVTLPPPRGHDPYQEVTEVPTIEGDLKLLSEQLKMPHLIYVPSFSATFGNAILSRYPFITSTTSILKNAKDVETRGMIAVEVDVGGANGNGEKKSRSTCIQVVMTHLDHQKEEARVVQLKEMLSLIDREKPHILMGDFNSLKKNDYTEEVWNVLTEIRKKNNWELPISDLTDSLERELGYTDTWAATLLQSGKEEEKIDYLFGTPTQTKSNPTRDNLWTRKVHKLATCWAGTRIDYIWTSQNFRFPVTSCQRIDTDASDHFPVKITFAVDNV